MRIHRVLCFSIILPIVLNQQTTLTYSCDYSKIGSALTQNPSLASRAQAEVVIRKTIYETAVASLTGDVTLYRRHIARRTLELIRLVYEGLREIPEDAQTLTELKLDTPTKFMDKMFKDGASQYAKLSREQIEEKAHAQANASLIFMNEQEAILQFAGATLRIVYEDNEWKVDETESSKKSFLENFQFTPETRAKIEKL